MVVERAKWKDCWDEIRFCSDRCKAEAKRARRPQRGTGRTEPDSAVASCREGDSSQQGAGQQG